MIWKAIKRYLPLIGIVLFVYLIIRLDITKIFQELKNVIWIYIAISVIFIIIFYILQTLKWFIIAKKQKINLSFKEAFKINFISNFYGFVTPGKLGTIIRADYLKKKGAETGKGISNFVIDKMLDICSLFILTIGFGFLLYQKVISEASLYIILGMFVLIIILFLVFYKKKYSRVLLKFVYEKLIPNRMKEKSRNLFNSFYEDIPPLSYLLFYFIVNLITWVVNYAIVYLIGLSLGINVNFFYFLMILPISTLVAQIPITIDGFGTREVTLIGLFGILGISAIKVFSMSMLSIIIVNIIPSLIAIIFILSERKNDLHKI
ncbi:MAG: lysylphosphatidylglycerol synthase transmembrane domain-containing protein [Nanoarchaeota archaeon]